MWASPEVLVVCPRCGNQAKVLLGGPESCGHSCVMGLVCSHCVYARTDVGGAGHSDEAVDPWFGCELWLAKPFRGHVLWAYNGRHLERLRDFIAAKHRERGPTPICPGGDRAGSMSMIEKLPTWMKEAKNRPALVALCNEMLAGLQTD